MIADPKEFQGYEVCGKDSTVGNGLCVGHYSIGDYWLDVNSAAD